MSVRYVVRPKADQDLDEQAYYLAVEANPELGHRFLIAAHETFALLSNEPEMGWHPKFRHPDLSGVRMFRVKGFENMLVLYRSQTDRIEILRIIHASRNLKALLRKEGVS